MLPSSLWSKTRQYRLQHRQINTKRSPIKLCVAVMKMGVNSLRGELVFAGKVEPCGASQHKRAVLSNFTATPTQLDYHSSSSSFFLLSTLFLYCLCARLRFFPFLELISTLPFVTISIFFRSFIIPLSLSLSLSPTDPSPPSTNTAL